MVRYNINQNIDGVKVSIDKMHYTDTILPAHTRSFKHYETAVIYTEIIRRDWILGSFNYLLREIIRSQNFDHYHMTRQKAERLERLKKLNLYINKEHRQLRQICLWITQLDPELKGAMPSPDNELATSINSIYDEMRQFIDTQKL